MSLLLELVKIDRKAALVFNREIKLRMQRGELNFDHYMFYGLDTVGDLVDSFNWFKTKQGYDYWEKILYKVDCL